MQNPNASVVTEAISNEIVISYGDRLRYEKYGEKSDFSELDRKVSASSLSAMWEYFLENGNENMMLFHPAIRCSEHRA